MCAASAKDLFRLNPAEETNLIEAWSSQEDEVDMHSLEQAGIDYGSEGQPAPQQFHIPAPTAEPLELYETLSTVSLGSNRRVMNEDRVRDGVRGFLEQLRSRFQEPGVQATEEPPELRPRRDLTHDIKKALADIRERFETFLQSEVK